jgi:hypothetical protein
MFKSIMTSFCICLQGTVFQRKPRKGCIKGRDDTWYYSAEGHEECPPYLLVAEEFKVKNDLITKMHTRDGNLVSSRESAKRGRAKWLPDLYEQVYAGPVSEYGFDPRVEVYYRTLGLAQTREPSTI